MKFTAKVTTPVGAPTGMVTLKDGATTLGTGPVSDGIAIFSTSTLSPGSHTITAAYGGDANFNGSTSSIVTQTLSKAGTTTTLAGAANPSQFDQAVALKATVTSATTGTRTGPLPSRTVRRRSERPR